jgi:hypothetical protein
MLAAAEADPSLRALLHEAAGGDSDAHGHILVAGPAPPTLPDLVRRAGQLCAKTILDPIPAPVAAATPAAHAHTSIQPNRPLARATAATPHPSSVLPELHDRCTTAYRSVAHAQTRPSDPLHPPGWAGVEGDAVRAAVGAPLLDSRADRLLSATAEALLLHLQNERRT